MEPQTQPNEEAQKPTTGDPGAGSEPSAVSLIEQARQEREGMERALAEVRAERAKIEELRAKEVFGGRAVAGAVPRTEADLVKEEVAAALKRFK